MRRTAITLALSLWLRLQATVAQNTAHDYPCMKREDAQQVADNWQYINAGYTDHLVDVSVVENFTAYADSSVTLWNWYACEHGGRIALPYGFAWISTREQLKAGSGQGRSPPFRQLSLQFTCETVAIRWLSSQSPGPVNGMAIIQVTKAPAESQFPWLITTVFTEYDSFRWIHNLGVNRDGPTPFK